MKLKLILLLFILCSLTFVIAEQPTQQYAKIYMNPLYRQSMDNDIWYDYTLTIETPDGISEVVNAMITMQLWLNPTVVFDLTVNGQTCNNPQYQVHTTYAGAGEGTIFFDCSNVITGSGVYNVRIRPSKDTGASTFWVDLTYFNNPRGEMKVHGTEYSPHDKGKVWLQLLNSSGEEIINGVCYVDIYTPSNEEFIEFATMTNLLHDGIYYYDFTIPQEYGVYPSIAKCYYDSYQDAIVASSYVVDWGKTDAGVLSDTYSLNGQYLKLKTSKDGLPPDNENRINATFTFDDYYTNCGNVSEELLKGITFYWAGEWNTGQDIHDIFIYTYNYTSNSWIEFSNEIYGGEGGDDFIVTNSIFTNNITKALGITSTNNMKLRFVDNSNGEGGKDFKNDYIYVSCDQLADPTWQEIRGSSEVHVTPKVWTDNYSTTRTITNFSGNFSEQLIDDIWNYNGTINSNLISQFVNAVWNYTQTISSTILNAIGLNVWSQTNRTLTDYNQTAINDTAIADAVWNENQSKYVYGTIIP